MSSCQSQFFRCSRAVAYMDWFPCPTYAIVGIMWSCVVVAYQTSAQQTSCSQVAHFAKILVALTVKMQSVFSDYTLWSHETDIDGLEGYFYQCASTQKLYQEVGDLEMQIAELEVCRLRMYIYPRPAIMVTQRGKPRSGQQCCSAFNWAHFCGCPCLHVA
jgi:hypothetical protein